MRVIVEQPTYLSWMGYFGMLDTADTFVFYDDVQFEKQSWQQRNRIKGTNGQAMWLTVPIIRNFGQKINEVKINNSTDWQKNHWKTLYQSYHKAPFFQRYANEVLDIYESKWYYLSELNIYIILKFAKMFDIRMPQIIKSSEIKGLSGHKTDRLIILLNKLKADEYITGYGTKGYIETDKFRDNEIKLYWYEYKPPIYPQIHGEFIGYLSAIDLLFNVGGDAIKYIREGLKTAITLDNTYVTTYNRLR